MSKQPEVGLAVAITGHRELAAPEAGSVALEKAISAIEQAFPGQAFRLLSPLAEGTDRLAATLILPRPGWTLWGILPLPVEKYRRTFSSVASQQEFDVLLEQAGMVLELRSPATQTNIYRKLGEYLVENCQVMLAIWDGLPARGPGGTAEIVALARKRSLPLALVTLVGGLASENSPTFECFPPPFA